MSCVLASRTGQADSGRAPADGLGAWPFAFGQRRRGRYFFLMAVRRGPLRVRALVWVR